MERSTSTAPRIVIVGGGAELDHLAQASRHRYAYRLGAICTPCTVGAARCG